MTVDIFCNVISVKNTNQVKNNELKLIEIDKIAVVAKAQQR